MKSVFKLPDLQMMFGPTWNNMSNFHPLEVMGRGSDVQLQVCENLNSITQRLKG